MAIPKPKLKPTAGYVTKKTQVSLPPDIPGASMGFRPGYGYYVKTPNTPPPKPLVPHPAAAPAARPAAGPPALDINSLMAQYFAGIPKPGQLAKTSAQTVADAIALQNAGIEAAYKTQREDLARQQLRAQGFATALGNLSANDPAQIASQYREGADRLAAYGTGLTGSVANEQQQQLDKARAGVAGILGPHASVAGYDPNAVRNVAVLGNVTHPATTLEANALDAFNRAGYNRNAQVQGVGAIAADYGQKINDIVQQIADKKAELEMQRPTMVRQELASETSASRQDLATLLQGLGLVGTQNLKAAQTASTKAGTSVKTSGTTPKGGTAAGFWLNPATGVREKVPGGTSIQKVNGVLTPVPVSSHIVTNKKTGVQRVVPNKVPGVKPPAGSTKHYQQTEKNGNTIIYDPSTGNSYLPGDMKNPIDPNTLKPKVVMTGPEIKQARAKAITGIQQALATDKKMRPHAIYTNGVSLGSPGWIMVWALKQEALNHKGDPAWDDVLTKNWVGRKKKK
jgi:hypothetical protein